MKSSKIPMERFAEAREWFAAHGVSISDWASQHNVDRTVLYAVLSGRRRCLRGEGHRIAVLLGLKPAPVERREADAMVVSRHEARPQEQEEIFPDRLSGVGSGQVMTPLSFHS